MGWLAAGDTYEVALVEGRVVARAASPTSPAGGRPKRSLPEEIRDRPEVIELQRFAEWLDRHAADCAAQVTNWMVSALPVPTGLLARVWPDEAWQAALRDIVVVGAAPDEVGFLRAADERDGLRVVNPDGETVRLAAPTVTMPHPVLLPDLEALRAFAAEWSGRAHPARRRAVPRGLAARPGRSRAAPGGTGGAATAETPPLRCARRGRPTPAAVPCRQRSSTLCAVSGSLRYTTEDSRHSTATYQGKSPACPRSLKSVPTYGAVPPNSATVSE